MSHLDDINVVVENLVHDPLLDLGGLGEVEPWVPLGDPVVEEDEGGKGLEAVRRGLIRVLNLDNGYLSTCDILSIHVRTLHVFFTQVHIQGFKKCLCMKRTSLSYCSAVVAAVKIQRCLVGCIARLLKIQEYGAHQIYKRFQQPWIHIVIRMNQVLF